MANGLIGNRGRLALFRVVEVANHEHVRVQILHQLMVGKIVLEEVQRHRHVQQHCAQVSSLLFLFLNSSVEQRFKLKLIKWI
jgi:hypothetical protein